MDNSVETLVDLPPMLSLYVVVWVFFVVGGFEVCTLSRFGRYCMLHLQGGWIVAVDFLNFRAAPPMMLQPSNQQNFSHPRFSYFTFFSQLHP